MTLDPLCFVLMPFGKKRDPSGRGDIDFDAIYEQGILPGIREAGLVPVRADEELTGGIIHKAMYERLLLCDFAVADLTTANANVFYELGIRHATRPRTTLTIFAEYQTLPFDVNFLRSIPYKLGDNNQFGSSEAFQLRKTLTERLIKLRELASKDASKDSPLFQLLESYEAPDIARLKTDIFREQVEYSVEIKKELEDSRNTRDLESIKKIENRLGKLDQVESGVIVDLFLSYRSFQAWDEMIRLYDEMPIPMQNSVLVREQLGFAYNRAGDRKKAIAILEDVVQKRGPSSETYGIMGRVYKDLWQEAVQKGDNIKGMGYLNKAIETYTRGFEVDFRDAYPGINAVTLLELKGDSSSLAQKEILLPVVRYAVMQRIKLARPDYWDYATLLELAVLAEDENEAYRKLADALANIREEWEPKTTANNLRFLYDARLKRGTPSEWLVGIIEELEKAGNTSSGG